MTGAAPMKSSRSRSIASSAGSLAVLLGYLNTYVVVTIAVVSWDVRDCDHRPAG
jgi:hypothetical protein